MTGYYCWDNDEWVINDEYSSFRMNDDSWLMINRAQWWWIGFIHVCTEYCTNNMAICVVKFLWVLRLHHSCERPNRNGGLNRRRNVSKYCNPKHRDLSLDITGYIYIYILTHTHTRDYSKMVLYPDFTGDRKPYAPFWEKKSSDQPGVNATAMNGNYTKAQILTKIAL